MASILKRSWQRLTGGSGRSRGSRAVMVDPRYLQREVFMDAEPYGVSIEPARVDPGGWYWQAIRVHHRTPQENQGEHRIYVDVVQPPKRKRSSGDERAYGVRVRVQWEDGEQTLVIDGPDGASFPLGQGQVCAVMVLGVPGAELPSDRVVDIESGHPAEGKGNTLFHHSFDVVFCRVQAAAADAADGVIYGTIRSAAGWKAVLLRDGGPVASQRIEGDDTFRFAGLVPGTYVVSVESTDLRSQPQALLAHGHVRLDLALELKESAIVGRVSNGAGRVVQLLANEVEITRQDVAESETYRFDGLGEGLYRVAILATPIISDTVVLDGTKMATVDLDAPLETRPLKHYVLFGPAEQPATRASLLLAADFLLAFTPAFGFNPDEAFEAGLVTIIADGEAVGKRIERELTAAGVRVQRIQGNSDAVKTALARRIAARRPYM